MLAPALGGRLGAALREETVWVLFCTSRVQQWDCQNRGKETRACEVPLPEHKPLPRFFAEGREGKSLKQRSLLLYHGQYPIPTCSEQSDILRHEELNSVP